MRVYEDHLLGGSWYWCLDCGQRNDGLGLAAATLGVEPSAILRHLAIQYDLPIGGDVVGRERYASHRFAYVDPVRHIDAILGHRRYVPDGAELDGYAPIHDQIGFPESPSASFLADWPYRAGRYMSHVTIQTIGELIWMRRIYNERALLRDRNTAVAEADERAVAWKHIFAIPFYDVPGRAVGMWCWGTNEEASETSYISVIRQSSAYRTHEAGVGFLDAVDPDSAAPIVCFTEPDLAVRAHINASFDSDRPPPVICAVDFMSRAPINAWEALGRSRSGMIVCGAPTASLFNVARSAGGLGVVLIDDEIRDLVRHGDPMSLAPRLRKRVVPWNDALDQALARPDVNAAALLAGIESPVSALKRRYKKRRVYGWVDRPINPNAIVMRSAIMGSKQVVEVEHRWYADGSQISNAAIDLDSVVFDGLTRTFFGSIRTRDAAVPFEFQSDSAFNPGIFFHDLLHAHGFNGYFFDRRWTKVLLVIAARMGRPEIRPSDGFIGWQAGDQKFNLPGWTFRPGEEPIATRRLLADPMFTPAVDLPAHDSLDVCDLEHMETIDGEHQVAAWALMLYAMEVAVARQRGEAPRHLTIPEEVGDEAARASVRAMGGLVIANERPHPWLMVTPHAWVSYNIVPTIACRYRSRFYATISAPEGSICLSNPYGMLLRRFLPGWSSIDLAPGSLDLFLDQDSMHYTSVGRILSAWLAEYCRNPPIGGDGQSTHAAVRAHARRWWTSFGLDPTPIDEVAARDRHDQSLALASALNRLHREGRLIGPTTPRSVPRAYVDHDHVGVSSAIIDQALYQAGSACRSLDQGLVEQVADSGLISVTPAGRMLRGAWYCFRRDWWDAGSSIC